MRDDFNVILMEDDFLKFYGFAELGDAINVSPEGGGAVYIKNDNPLKRNNLPVFILEDKSSNDEYLIDLLEESLGYHFVLNEGVYYQSHIFVNTEDES